MALVALLQLAAILTNSFRVSLHLIVQSAGIVRYGDQSFRHYVAAKKTIHMYAIYMTPLCCYQPLHGLRMHGEDVS